MLSKLSRPVSLQVVAYCHDMGVVHRDLKLENFLMEGQGCCVDRIKVGAHHTPFNPTNS